MNSLNVTIQMKATEKYFPMVLSSSPVYRVVYKVDQTVEFLDKSPKV